MDPLLVMLKAEGTRKEGLTAELNRLTQRPSTAHLDRTRLKRELLNRIKDAKELLGR